MDNYDRNPRNEAREILQNIIWACAMSLSDKDRHVNTEILRGYVGSELERNKNSLLDIYRNCVDTFHRDFDITLNGLVAEGWFVKAANQQYKLLETRKHASMDIPNLSTESSYTNSFESLQKPESKN